MYGENTYTCIYMSTLLTSLPFSLSLSLSLAPSLSQVELVRKIVFAGCKIKASELIRGPSPPPWAGHGRRSGPRPQHDSDGSDGHGPCRSPATRRPSRLRPGRVRSA